MRPQLTVSMRRLTLALSLCLLAGCATVQHMADRLTSLRHPDYPGQYWAEPNAARDRYNQDSAACKEELKGHPRVWSWQAAEDAYFGCLYARGWREPGP